MNKFLLLLLLTIGTRAQLDQTCNFSFNVCPENIEDDTLYVPKNTASLAPSITLCSFSNIVEGIDGDGSPPSIMFIVDNSNSMTGANAPDSILPNDRWGSRFSVTSDLIDSIYAVYPNAEIGLIVFQEKLYFDTRHDEIFQPLDIFSYPAFIPLLQLDSIYRSKETGLQILKQYLKLSVQ